MSQDLHSVNVCIPYGAGTTAAGTSNYLALAIPGTAYGGGIYLAKWYYGANKAIAAGSAPAVNLITLTSTGGTIGTICANGSAALSAGTPVTGTITTAWVPGTVSFLAVQVCHDAYAATDVALNAVISYYMGRGSA